MPNRCVVAVCSKPQRRCESTSLSESWEISENLDAKGGKADAREHDPSASTAASGAWADGKDELHSTGTRYVHAYNVQYKLQYAAITSVTMSFTKTFRLRNLRWSLEES